MRIIGSAILTTLALAVAVLSGTIARPAEAGPACNRIGFNGPCIKSNDLRARLNLDEDGKNARLRLRDAAGANAVELDAGSGNLTNLFSNEANESNGLVKAWARIAPNGAIVACWRCNMDAAETQRLEDGTYEIDFTPLATDISGRPMLATIGGTFAGGTRAIRVEPRGGDPSSVFVNAFNLSGEDADSDFVLIIY